MTGSRENAAERIFNDLTLMLQNIGTPLWKIREEQKKEEYVRRINNSNT